ncbi:hypothetical protein IMZ48_36260 [Candidatus Bathyarchaeota archaeon]|nr:hypothetical protein [Candidatus Bathyarchaeota archaeon]
MPLSGSHVVEVARKQGFKIPVVKNFDQYQETRPHLAVAFADNIGEYVLHDMPHCDTGVLVRRSGGWRVDDVVVCWMKRAGHTEWWIVDGENLLDRDVAWKRSKKITRARKGDRVKFLESVGFW